MSAQILKANRFRARRLIDEKLELTAEEMSVMTQCLVKSLDVWLGMIDDEIYCVWGVIPPTILSLQAYLWLYVDPEKVIERQFIFIRRSQIAVKEMLEHYDSLYGTTSGEEKTLRWLKWLGAEIEHSNNRIEFTIRRK